MHVSALTDLYHNLAKVVRVAGVLEKPYVADSPGLLTPFRLLEAVLLDIADSLSEECNSPEDDTDDICGLSKARLWVLQHVRRVQDSHWHADSPYPEHLEHPETQEFEKAAALIVEAVILARLENPEKEKSSQPARPGDEKDTGDDLPCICRPGHRQCNDGKDDEVGATPEVRELVEFQGEGDGKADELIGHCN